MCEFIYDGTREPLTVVRIRICIPIVCADLETDGAVFRHIEFVSALEDASVLKPDGHPARNHRGDCNLAVAGLCVRIAACRRLGRLFRAAVIGAAGLCGRFRCGLCGFLGLGSPAACYLAVVLSPTPSIISEGSS